MLIIYIYFNKENKLKIKEPFAVQDDIKAAINEVYQADVDAIRNLSALANKLQAGGLTAAGNLSVTGELILTGANTWMLHTPDDGRKTLYFGKGTNGGIDAWPVNFEENGTINTTGNIIAAGRIQSNEWLRVNGDRGILFESFGGGWRMTDDTWIRSYNGKNVYSDAEIRANRMSTEADLTVGGNFRLSNPLYRNHMVAGYFHIKFQGRSTPLYYGWNMLWQDGDVRRIAARLMLYEFRSGRKGAVHNSKIDMRAHNDDNWRPRRLVVFPGYTARFYYYNQPSQEADKFPNAGDYDWTNTRHKNNKGQNVHMINISLSEQGVFPRDDLTCQLLANYGWDVGTFPIQSLGGRDIDHDWDLA
jgi:hypothetical protein